MRCFKPLNSSPSLLVCALAGAFACAASAAPAANDVQSIWLAPTGTSPLSAKAPLRIEISPAESQCRACLLYTSPSPRDVEESRMPSSA